MPLPDWEQLAPMAESIARAYCSRSRQRMRHAQDAASVAMIALWQAAGTYRPDACDDFKPWAIKNIRWRLADYMRGQLRHDRQARLSELREKHGSWRQSPPERKRESSPRALTAREIQIAEEISRGLTEKAAAKKLGVSPKTINSAMANVRKKLMVKTTTHAVRVMIELGHMNAAT